MIILGIDPGTQVTGFGMIALHHEGAEVIDYGCIRPPSQLSCHQRYLIIFNAIEDLIEKHHPHALAVETQFVYRNIQSAMKLGIARGMAILAAMRKEVPVFEYAPRKAKLAITGQGNASKSQMQRMIQLLLHLPHLPTPEDAADALAIALCHAHTIDTNSLHRAR